MNKFLTIKLSIMRMLQISLLTVFLFSCSKTFDRRDFLPSPPAPPLKYPRVDMMLGSYLMGGAVAIIKNEHLTPGYYCFTATAKDWSNTYGFEAHFHLPHSISDSSVFFKSNDSVQVNLTNTVKDDWTGKPVTYTWDNMITPFQYGVWLLDSSSTSDSVSGVLHMPMDNARLLTANLKKIPLFK